MRVKSVQYLDLSKSFRLANGSRLTMHCYRCLGTGDDLVVTRNDKAHARCRNGTAQILPCYTAYFVVRIGARRVPLTVKEIETAEELVGYHQLEVCHYRGKVLHGRRVPLIVVTNDPRFPTVLGYI